MRGGGADTSGDGPAIDGSGSRRASALRIGPDGGSSTLSSRRIAERWMSRAQLVLVRRLRDDRRDDPHDAERQRRAEQRPEQPVQRADVRERSARGARESPGPPCPRRGSRRPAARRPGRARAHTARPSLRCSSRGARRVPRNAPMANPPNESTPTMNPRRKPKPARIAANATMIQSSPVTRHVLPRSD